MQDDPQPVWHFQLLGLLRATCEISVLENFQTQKTAVLLAYLVYPPHRKHSREELIDLLWPEALPEAGRKRLSQALFWLRSHLEFTPEMHGKILLADRQTIGFNPQAMTVDVAEFEAASVRITADAPFPTSRLERAADLYQGDLLPGCYDDWVLTERQRLLTLHLSTLQALVQHYEQAEEWERALSYVRRALAADPLDEERHCTLMRLLWASGQADAALRQFRELGRLLDKELGETPSPAAQALMEQIRQAKTQQIRQAQKVPPPTRREETTPPAVVRPLTRFFGRDAEMSDLRTLLDAEDVRLVTLTGTAGSGKTRLALETVAQIAEDDTRIAWFVSLVDISDPALIPNVISAAMRLPAAETSSPLEQVAKVLAQRPSLLVLDNAEHLVEGARPLVRSLLEGSGSLKIMITSQQRLALDGEREFPLYPLTFPTAQQYPGGQFNLDQLMQVASVRLFVDRAQAVRPAFAVTPQNAGVITQLCARLEGLPLAIELCASWAQTLTPAQMLTQLTRRFDLLVSRRSDIAIRHRSLHMALEYSYLLLSPDLQQFFLRLSVFRGGWTLEAAEAVCLDDNPSETAPSAGGTLRALMTLTELRERSLLIAEEKPDSGAVEGMRYRMLEALREFAAAQRTLAVDTPLRRRHALFFLAVAEEAEPQMLGPKQAIWLSRLEAEHENLRAALAWTLETSVQAEPDRQETGLRLAADLRMFWETRGYVAEGQEWLKRLLATPLTEEPSPRARLVWVKALNAQASLARARADFPAAEASARQALELGRALGEEAEIASALTLLASVAVFRGDTEGAKALLAEALLVGRTLSIPGLVATILLNWGSLATNQQDWPAAKTLLSESLEISQAEGNENRVSVALNNLGLVARYQGDLKSAETLFREELEIARRLSHRSYAAIALLNLGTVYRLTGRFAEAWEMLQEASALVLAVDNNRVMAWCIKGLGHLACATGQWLLGTRLLSASESLRQSLGISFSPADPQELSRDAALARSQLGEEAFQSAWQAGSQWDISRAYDEAAHAFSAWASSLPAAPPPAGYEI